MSKHLAAIGSLLADPTRAEILTTLMGGRALTGSELARQVGVAPSTTSEHLSRLLDAGVVAVDAQGRHRYWRLANRQVAELLETIGATFPDITVTRPSPPHGLAFARTCYDHLAGRLAVGLFERMVNNGHLVESDHQVALTTSGATWLEFIGVERSFLEPGRRPITRTCLDWTERRHHLAGTAGQGLLQALLHHGLVQSGSRPRTVVLTESGRTELDRWFGADLVRAATRDEAITGRTSPS